jgi:hypothetical protein
MLEGGESWPEMAALGARRMESTPERRVDCASRRIPCREGRLPPRVT